MTTRPLSETDWNIHTYLYSVWLYLDTCIYLLERVLYLWIHSRVIVREQNYNRSSVKAALLHLREQNYYRNRVNKMASLIRILNY